MALNKDKVFQTSLFVKFKKNVFSERGKSKNVVFSGILFRISQYYDAMPFEKLVNFYVISGEMCMIWLAPIPLSFRPNGK